MTARQEFSRKVRVEAFRRADGRCEGCRANLFVGKYAYDHIIPDGLGGEPTLDNCEVLCAACHGAKTAGADVPRIAKMKRQRDKHIGAATRKSRPLFGTKASGWRCPINGRPERRT